MTKPQVRPARWTPPPAGPAGTPVKPSNLRVRSAPGDGTEDVLVRDDGHVVTGLADGRIVAIDPVTGGSSEIAHTGGRPLGIEHHPAGGYVVCDAHRGLLHVGEEGGIEVLADSFEGARFIFCNNAAVAADGTIYFTDSSTKFEIDHWLGDLIEHRPTGRLFRRDIDGTLTLLMDGLAFANGVALAPDESFVVVAETGAYMLHRVWLSGRQTGPIEPFGPVLPGFPDNISTGEDGNIWVTIASPRDKLLDVLLPKAPVLRSVVWALPAWAQPHAKKLIRIHAYDVDGHLVHDVAGRHDRFGMPTGVRQVGGHVWMGSLEQPTIAVFDLPSASGLGPHR
ncbi:SMP-30/gluconolactonase/LRE family protein [Aeromicrobium wangtongii]|uniref:SMP-30/gluconolactonase/LRE family protein n=1 Tax=Aeromicrobium wangtongii TaxID=2969247 RepID=UPI002016DC50|nr:SMP-30/gluconolactonase/LRE family protein [Aeromicrobium wangtongii]MCL3819522.1 SMP-30/gluconolactonase/LRE family protein [Aeromicrobium wangtongii]